jgi:hypothetical protein
VINQLTVASNDVVANKKLIKTLSGALKLIDKTKTNYVGGSKSLGSLARTLNRTTVSNEFHDVLQATADTYVSELLDEEGALADRLAPTYPSGSRTAAQRQLDLMLAAIQGANTNDSVVTAARFLSIASKKQIVAAKLVTKAENAPPPPAGVTASITGALRRSFKSFTAVITNPGGGTSIIVNSATKPSASGLDSLAFSLTGVTDGTHTVNLEGEYSQVRVGGRAFTGDGTATVTFNSTTKVIFGTFSFIGSDDDGSVTVSGSFSGTAL